MISSTYQRNLRPRFGRSAAAPQEQEQQYHRVATSDGKTPPIVASILTGRRLIIFSYICVWTSFYLLVHYASDEDSKFSGQRQDSSISSRGNGRKAVTNSAFFVICVEMIKILVSAGLYMKDHTLIGLRSFIRSGNMKSLLLRYMPVAILYAIYNNLMFINLRSTRPSTYLVISSSRLLMTAVAWQWAFKVQIPPIRQLAIMLITSGILAKDCLGQGQDPVSKVGYGDEDLISSSYLATVMLILVQMACSVMAGIYNEKLLKDDVCNQYLQNICLYVNSIGINILIGGGIVISRKDEFDFASEMKMLMSPISIAIVFTLATAGITSAMVLRYENSITKGIASASETALTAMIECFWYGRVFMVPESFGITLVCAGTALYFFSPSTRKKRNLVC
jgi:drug/metabolite transporter (DMT)-like permease